jgi:hypothetical protein
MSLYVVQILGFDNLKQKPFKISRAFDLAPPNGIESLWRSQLPVKVFVPVINQKVK